MAKPQFYSDCTYAFDATEEHEFKYIWDSNSNQSISSILTIKDNDTNELIYDMNQESLILKHVLPANTLQNGKTYNAVIQTCDIDNNISECSNKIIFKCYTKPSFKLNVENNQVVRSSSYGFGIEFNQIEGEELQFYLLELCDSNLNYLYTTNIKYNTNANIIITDLQDNSSYYIRAIGQTINHVDVVTDYIKFNVDYIKPESYAYMTAENRMHFGDIQLTSFLVSIEGIGINGDAVYINNDYIDTINGTSIKFNKNFQFSNGVLNLYGRNITYNHPFLIMTNDKYDTMEFTWRYGCFESNNDEVKCYVELVCYDGDVCTVHNSNFISATTNFINITIKIIDNYIDIKVGE